MAYLSHTDSDRLAMLEQIGVSDFEQLLANIPQQLRLTKPLDIRALSEMELLNEISSLAKKNKPLVNFAGAGIYDHFIPSAVSAIISRPEFMTAYTPYQAEVSQGTLQVIYEFQTHICRLTGMDVANASMYDGASAAAEAAIVSTAVTRRKKVIVAETLSPWYRAVIKTYLAGRGVELVTLPMNKGGVDLEKLKSTIDDQSACLVVSQPNFFGLLEEVDEIAELTHAVGAKLVLAVDPIAQAILKTPGETGADIVVGEGQPLGIPMSFGGPLLGFFAASKELVRYVPGRLAGRTKDVDGREGFVLTLQTREQHIRRDRATSNICTNQALCATAASVYLSLMGKQGLKQVALLSTEKAQQTMALLSAIEGVEPYFDRPFVREFPIKLPVLAESLIRKLVEADLLPGISVGKYYPSMDNCLVIALTEKRTKTEIGRLADLIKESIGSGIMSGVQ